MLLTLLLALFIIFGDQISKMQIVLHMQPGQDIPVIPGILHLHYAQNSGAAFSFLEGSGAQWVFIIASVAASIGIVWYLASRKARMHRFLLTALGLIMGGALGNLVDRIRTPDHHVIDFIYFKVINFAIFNVADSCITVGAILLCVYLLFMHENYIKKLHAQKPVESQEPEGGQA